MPTRRCRKARGSRSPQLQAWELDFLRYGPAAADLYRRTPEEEHRIGWALLWADTAGRIAMRELWNRVGPWLLREWTGTEPPWAVREFGEPGREAVER